jgi:hypothetical protein
MRRDFHLDVFLTNSAAPHISHPRITDVTSNLFAISALMLPVSGDKTSRHADTCTEGEHLEFPSV